MRKDVYLNKIAPFLEKNPTQNPFLTVPFFGTGFELDELTETLRDDEVLRYITACKLNYQRVLVCVTNYRFHILQKGLVVSKSQQSIDLSKISSVSRGRDLIFGTVRVNFLGNEEPLLLTGFWFKDTENFQQALQNAMTDFNMGKAFSSGYQGQFQQPVSTNGFASQGFVQNGFAQTGFAQNGFGQHFFGSIYGDAKGFPTVENGYQGVGQHAYQSNGFGGVPPFQSSGGFNSQGGFGYPSGNPPRGFVVDARGSVGGYGSAYKGKNPMFSGRQQTIDTSDLDVLLDSGQIDVETYHRLIDERLGST